MCKYWNQKWGKLLCKSERVGRLPLTGCLPAVPLTSGVAMQRRPWALYLCLLISWCTRCVLRAGFRKTNFPKSLVLLAADILHSSVSVPCLHSMCAGSCAHGTDPAEKSRKKEKYGVWAWINPSVWLTAWPLHSKCLHKRRDCFVFEQQLI